MRDADTWALLLIVDTTDTRVLAEAVVEFRKNKAGVYVIANPPIELTVEQPGKPGFMVLTNLRGNTILRTAYSGRSVLNQGDGVRIKEIRVTV